MTNETSEIIESSKAVQEVAKASTKALETAEKFGGFMSRYIDGPLEQAMGIFEDKLKYIRWERQERLFLRAQDFIEQEGAPRLTRAIPLKHAVPLIFSASLEEDNELQDVWAKLLVNFTIETSTIVSSRTYIDILERLSSLEVVIVNSVYSNDYDSLHHTVVLTQYLPERVVALPEKIDDDLMEATKIEPSIEIKLALANLDRLGVVAVGRFIDGGANIWNTKPNPVR
jgi:hypothetical protein